MLVSCMKVDSYGRSPENHRAVLLVRHVFSMMSAYLLNNGDISTDIYLPMYQTRGLYQCLLPAQNVILSKAT
jgi:hypothetical protein